MRNRYGLLFSKPVAGYGNLPLDAISPKVAGICPYFRLQVRLPTLPLFPPPAETILQRGKTPLGCELETHERTNSWPLGFGLQPMDASVFLCPGWFRCIHFQLTVSGYNPRFSPAPSEIKGPKSISFISVFSPESCCLLLPLYPPIRLSRTPAWSFSPTFRASSCRRHPSPPRDVLDHWISNPLFSFHVISPFFTRRRLLFTQEPVF